MAIDTGYEYGYLVNVNVIHQGFTFLSTIIIVISIVSAFWNLITILWSSAGIRYKAFINNATLTENM